jgi:uncharacterized protein (DUF952 family)
MRVFHLTTAADWVAAQASGSYTMSTRGRTLAQEGFVHCSSAEQVASTRATFFAGVPDVVVLEVETDLLSSPWRLEPVGAVEGTVEEADRFPHVYGPLDLDAVVAVVPDPFPTWLREVPTSAATSSAHPQDSVTPAPPCP